MISFINRTSSGNSSRLVERRNLPKGVKRAESSNNFPSEFLSSVIDLNFTISKGIAFNPGLICLNRIGDPSFNLTNTAATIKIGRIIGIVKIIIVISNNRFTLYFG